MSKLLGCLKAAGSKNPDNRRAGYNKKYRLYDGIICAFVVFFFQHPSLLDFQRAMKERKKRSNMETLFGLPEIPSDSHIRTMLDSIEPESLGEVFAQMLQIANEAGALKPYRVMNGGVLIALESLWYYSSQKSGVKAVCTEAIREKRPITTARWQAQ